jgi:hypothetical protein
MDNYSNYDPVAIRAFAEGMFSESVFLKKINAVYDSQHGKL